jgi:hypothetical protein
VVALLLQLVYLALGLNMGSALIGTELGTSNPDLLVNLLSDVLVVDVGVLHFMMSKLP